MPNIVNTIDIIIVITVIRTVNIVRLCVKDLYKTRGIFFRIITRGKCSLSTKRSSLLDCTYSASIAMGNLKFMHIIAGISFLITSVVRANCNRCFEIYPILSILSVPFDGKTTFSHIRKPYILMTPYLTSRYINTCSKIQLSTAVTATNLINNTTGNVSS